ncbi:MAG TPA: glycosyltransferase, partial [Chloroflexota bacterium]|nr:glycosyltransferase [Chloroflexota bacterium]
AAALGLENVTFVPAQPKPAMPGIMRRADVLFNSGMRYPMVETDLPAKTMEYLATGRPVISCGQAKAVMSASDGGIWVPPEDPESMTEAILRLYHDPTERDRLGVGGREYALSHFNRLDVLRAYEDTLVATAGRT